MDPKKYFAKPETADARQYEALRAFYQEGLSADDAAQRMGFSPSYFKKLRYEFGRALRRGENPFFPKKKTGPKGRRTPDQTVSDIVSLRKLNHSIGDIKSVLEARGVTLSLETIDKILKDEGFAPLPKRTRAQRLTTRIPEKISAPQAAALVITNEEFTTQTGAGILVFLPLLERLGIVEAIRASGFPRTSALSDVQSVLSFLALKLMGGERLSHDDGWNMDRALGLFAGLNVLPKSTTLSTYSYRVTRESNRKLLVKLCEIFRDDEVEQGDFNLDFKAIPHWGDDSVLERNWSGSRNKAIKSLLAAIVQDPATGFVSYTDAQVKHAGQNDVVLDFVDFWREGRGAAPKMLIFDSKFTTYENLDKLNKAQDGPIKFLTLRRRGRMIVERARSMTPSEWETIQVDRAKGKKQLVRVHDAACELRGYEGLVRQIILTDHGRSKPAFLLTNDFDLDTRAIVEKYARRWLVEQEIAEHIAFFGLNRPSSSIVVKVDFDLTISLLAHNLYRVLARRLPGFERCTVPTIYRKFLDNGANVQIKEEKATVQLRKKTHLPILFELPWMKESTTLSWVGLHIAFAAATAS